MNNKMKPMQQSNLLWTGIEYYSLENCLVSPIAHGYEINSVIIGLYEDKIYRVDYLIRTTENWETLLVDITCRHNNKTHAIHLQSDAKGNWQSEGKSIAEFQDCIDVDISLTPFTNTLPINRLQLGNNKKEQIKVIYFDLLQQEMKPVYQNYTRIADQKYHYENVLNDFNATILVDEDGFVVNYPALFTRTAKHCYPSK